MNRLAHQQLLYNTLCNWNLSLYFSKPVMRHLVHMMDGIMHKGCSGTLTDIHHLSHMTAHRTTLSHFLSRGVWDESVLQRLMQKQAHRQAKQNPHEPVFLILDDTICEKTKPSSQAEHAMEGSAFHFSHVARKSVWGHQLLSMMMGCGTAFFPYAFDPYEKEGDTTKIQMAKEMVRSVSLDRLTYVLVDSWFTSRTMVEACLSTGKHLIGALKSNRILYPAGIRQQTKEFAAYIQPSDTRLVTVGTERYRVYRYEGALNEIANAVVLFCWKADQPMEEASPRYFLCTDMELSTESILEYYAKRWNIESFFRQTKHMLGLDRYQVRSKKAIRRYWTLVWFTYFFCMTATNVPFSDGLLSMRKQQTVSIIEFIYYETKQGMSLEDIKKRLQAA